MTKDYNRGRNHEDIRGYPCDLQEEPRQKLYESTEALQQDLDEWLTYYKSKQSRAPSPRP